MAEDYYKTLGVARSASQDEIQKAYRKLARQYHPDLHADKDEKDRNQAKQKFQKVQQAYDVLSEPDKRSMYDQFGDGFEQMRGGPFGGPQGGNPFGGGFPGGGFPGGGPGGGSFEDILRQMGMGGGGGAPPRGRPGGMGGFEDIFRQMGGRGSAKEAPPQEKGEDLEQEIMIPFAVAVLGGTHQVQFQRGSGKVDTIDVKIPAGIEQDQKIRLRGQGYPNPYGGQPGDLLVSVKTAPHPNYTRSGLNLNVTVPISIQEATLGAKINLKTPHGKVAITVPAGSSSGKPLRLRGMGIRKSDRSGDLIATLQIVVPKSISTEDQEKINSLSSAWEVTNRDETGW